MGSEGKVVGKLGNRMEEEEEGRQDLPAPPEEEAVRTVDQAEPNPVIHTAHESATQSEVVAAVEGSNHDDAGGVIDAEEVEVEIHPDASTALEADQTPPSSPPPIPPRPVDEIPLLDPTIPKRMYYCVVCMENETFGEQSFELTSSCQHVYCTDCLAGYLISKIIDGQVYPRCFVPKKIPKGGKSRPGSDNTSRIGSSSSGAANSSNASTLLIDEEKGSNEAEDTEDVPCNIPMLEADILKVLTPHTEAHEKYIRFKFCRENPQARECSHCHVFNIGDPANPKITCSHCQDVYCYNHSNAHDFMKYPTCEEYEAELKKEIQESEELIAR